MHMHISSPSTSTYSYDSSKVHSTSHATRYPSTHVLSPGSSVYDPRSPSISQSPYGLASPQYPPSGRAPQLGNIPLPGEDAAGRHLPSSQRVHGSRGSRDFQFHPALVYNPSGVIYFNLLYPTENIRFKRSAQPTQLSEAATYPALSRLVLRLSNQALQVDLPITVDNPNGLTLYDILHQIYIWFQAGISRQEMSSLSPQQRTHLSDTFARRTANTPNEYHAGLKRLDWLGQNTFFLGLSPASDGSGSWFINFGSQPAA